ETELLEIVEADHRAGLGQTVPLEDRDADDPEKLVDVPVQGGAARAGEPQVAAEALAQLAEDDPVGEGVLEAQPKGGVALDVLRVDVAPPDGQGPPEHGALEEGELVHALEDARVDLFEQPGDADDQGR